MAHRIKGTLATPPWLFGPGLLVPPVFLSLIICVYPRPVEPRLPIPSIDEQEADQHLRRVSLRTSELERTLEVKTLIENWAALRELDARPISDERRKRAMAQQEMASSCQEAARSGGGKRPLQIGEKMAWDLTRSVTRLEIGDPREVREALRLGGGFVSSARSTGLLGQRGELRVHPVVIFALASVGWRLACGLRDDVGMVSIDHDAVDLFRIGYGQKLPATTRLESVDSYARRHPDYPVTRAKAAILAESRSYRQMEQLLLGAVRESPDDIALVNYLLFAREGRG